MSLRTSLIVLVATAFLLFGSVYVVHEGQSAIVLNLGKVVRTDIGPGLHFKVPLIESYRVFDRRLQVLSAEPERFNTKEQLAVSIDFFALGRVQDVSQFYRATGGDEAKAVDLLRPIVKDALKNEINSRTLQQVVSGDREAVVARQIQTINRGASSLGVRIVDIRIKQVDLPSDSNVLASVYDRMRSQRQQAASQLRAEGVEQAQTIRARAERDRAVILAEAERDAQKLRGEGDAEAARIYGEAASKDPAFFAFQRSLDAYR
jgi:membrane protease subunit HflC